MRGMSLIAGHRPQNQTFDLLFTFQIRLTFLGLQSYSRINSATSPASGAGKVSGLAVM